LVAARTVGGVARRRSHALTPVAGILAAGLLAGCAGVDQQASQSAAGVAEPSSAPSSARSQPSPTGDAGATAGDAGRATPAEDTTPRASRPAREPRRSFLTVPALGLRSVPVVRYRGTPDDAEGTRIQNGGPTASPRGRGGGVGPGEVGNFIVTGHRTSHTEPFRDLPALRAGDRVHVRTGPTTYVYRVTKTRWTSFRSKRSLAEQSAAVPGRPGAEPVRPMITLSTCATPEDHAAGNYWSDRFGNPEHRIDKIGVLVRQTRSGA
jgi:sortase A